MNQCINDEIANMNNFSDSDESSKDELLKLLAKSAYRYGEFTLSSGIKSHHYVNCKPISLSGLGLHLISRLIIDEVELDSAAVAGLTLGADPLVSGVAMLSAQIGRSLDALIVRKEAKGYGTGAWIEGPMLPKGSVVTVLEDVVTTGASSLKAVQKLRNAGYVVKKVIAIVDREEGGDLLLKNEGLQFIRLFLLKDVASKAIELKK